MKRLYFITLLIALHLAVSFGQRPLFSLDIPYQKNAFQSNSEQSGQPIRIKNSNSIHQSRLDSLVVERYSTTENIWINSYKYNFRFDDNWNVIERTALVFDDNGQKIIEGDKFEYDYIYDSLYHLANYYNLRPNTGAWEIYYKSDFIYSNNLLLVEKNSMNFNKINNAWEPDFNRKFTYDSSKKLIDEIQFEWSNSKNDWIYGIKNVYTYNEVNQLIENTRLFWNSITNDWTNSVKYKYQYTNEKRVSYTKLEWNFDSLDWSNNSHEEHTYDSEGNETSHTKYFWNDYLNKWSYNSRDEFFCDVNGNDTLTISFKWNDDTSIWENYERDRCSYDDFGNIMLRLSDKWNTSNAEWDKYVKARYYNTTLGLPNSNKEIEIAPYLYPNPANDYISFSSSIVNTPTQISLYNSQGVLFLIKELSSNEQIDIRSFPEGVYFYQLKINDTYTYGRLLIQ